MNTDTKNKFMALWARYFNGAELPIILFYSNEDGHAEVVKPGSMPRCLIADLAEVRKGRSLAFAADSVGCLGGRKYLGFADKLRPDFEYFLSCGIPGKMEGERYKKTPELVKESMKYWPAFKAPARYAVFKRWDMVQESDSPEVVIFFAVPSVLSGLFTLANFDQAEPNGVIAPFGSGCSSIVQNPYMERSSARPRAVIGMFDVSARPHVPENTLSFAVPMNKFSVMIENMEGSFLTTKSWAAVQKKIG